MTFQLRLSTLLFLVGVCLAGAVYLACSPYNPPANKVDHFAIGQVYYQDNVFDRACEELEIAVSDDPKNLEAHTLLGLAYAQRGMVEPAISHLEVPAAENVDRVDVYSSLARLYQKKKMYEQALACALQAKKLAPESISLGNLLGSVYVDQGKYNKAIAEYEKALEKQDRAWVRNNLGLLYIQTGEWEKAHNQLLRAVFLDPKNAVAHNNLGVVYQHLDRYMEARREFAEAVRLDPKYNRAKFNLDKLDIKLSRFQ